MRAAMLLEPLPSTFACFFTPKVPLFCVKNSKRSGTFCYLLLKTKRSLSPFTVIHSKRSHRAKGRLGQRSSPFGDARDDDADDYVDVG